MTTIPNGRAAGGKTPAGDSGSRDGHRKPEIRISAAFSLVEVTIALGVAGFCLLAILGLLQTGLTSEKATAGQTAAGGILTAVFSDIASTPATNSTTPVFQFSLANQTPASPQTVYFSEVGEPTGNVGEPPDEDSRYRASVGIQSPPANSTAPAVARILVTWPAAADTVPNQWPTKASGSVEVVTTLDRN